MIKELLKTALSSLFSNKTRSFLTMLGIIIGVFAVVTLISIGQGIQNFVTSRFSNLGSNLIFVAPGKLDLRGDPGANYLTNKLDEKHFKLIETYSSDYIKYLTPMMEIGKNLSFKNKTYYSVVQATNEEGNLAYNIELVSGKYFEKSDVTTRNKVVVIGSEIAKEFFSNQEALGNNIKIDDKVFTVIGVAKEKGGQLDSRVYIPYTTAKRLFNIERFSALVMQAKSPDLVDSGIKSVENALLRDLDGTDFTVLSQKEILDSFTSILANITIGIGAIAAISLLVGGIGIMNIMLVTVTERTREIGLRKAVGATPNNIALQFMVEATSLSVLGGVIGLTLGILVAFIIKTYFGFEAEVPLWSVILAFSFSFGVGVIFGTYPAIKASQKDPIEALRYE
ncbi:FtsX-like permease family protein [bacterium]|nr:FtsX-like permease family protein [bacterium]NBO36155.1 FtsX-like permease family protein [bacterium]